MIFFLALITRCKDESFITEFCNYYISQGVDKIYIIDDNSNDKTIYNNLNDNKKIQIHYMSNINSKCHSSECKSDCTCNRVIANRLYNKIKNNFKWLIYVDVDEYITTRQNIKKTIRDELMTTFRDYDCILIPWVMMSSYGKKNPKSILENNIYRINYDKKYNFKCSSKKQKGKFSTQSSGKYIQLKSIFKCSKFNGIHDKKNPSDHHPVFPLDNVKIVDGVYCKKIQNLYDNRYTLLSENDIKNGYLFCYHYRIISEEHAMFKLKNNDWYIENGYTLKDLDNNKSMDVIDLTLKNKYMKKEYIFIYNPRTGGNTIETLLKIPKNHKYIYLRKNEIKDKYSFTFVRHPVSRIISWYNHLLKHLYFQDLQNNELNNKSKCYNLLKRKYKMGPSKHRELAENNNINNWIKIMFSNINEYNKPAWGPLSFQYKYVFDLDCKTQLVSDFFRFEQYEKELKILLKKLKKDHLIKDIAQTNHSKKISEKLNSESLELIYNYFKKDFDLFNYKIDDYNN
jgi:hypothetical protein